MTKIFILISTIFTFNSYAAVDFTINSLCADKDIVKTTVDADQVYLGDLTLKLLDQNKITYVGWNDGMSSIQNSPTGDDAIQVVSDTELRAFGWCYKIDGTVSESMPDAILIDKSVHSIRWYYGFAHYVKGNWISQCEDDKMIVRKLFCK
jgi:hypothetical protein